MDIAPVYELRTRLRTAAIAGTNLLSEDFRLKKALENFAPLSSTSPVFTKIYEMTGKLIQNGSPEELLDTITLVDSVITTLGTVESAGSPEPLDLSESPAGIINAPYTALAVVITALTGAKGGNLNADLEIFRDYRVMPYLKAALGMSAGLADTAVIILKKMGQPVLPMLKRDFDPKGKKEMQRRLHIIETIGGKNEKAFYLEQIPHSEKDLRRLLIYSLRFDESNAELLIEFAKTEKGKIRDAAFCALGSMENEKCHLYFEECAEKDPIYILNLMRNITTTWSGGLTARLIRRILDNENIPLSQLPTAKLKAKIDKDSIAAAMYGKCGPEIEQLYREILPENDMVFLHLHLGNSIVVTRDESLRKLAIELNHTSKTKGRYFYAELIARILGNEDCSEWFEEQLKAACHGKNSAELHNHLFTVMRFIRFKDGSYYLTQLHKDWINDDVIEVNAKLKLPVKTAITDLMIQYKPSTFDGILSFWIDPDDREYCQKLGSYFCKLCVQSDRPEFQLRYIEKCGLKNIKGLALDYCKNHSKNKYYSLSIKDFVLSCPGDNDYKLAEAQSIIDYARQEKPSWFDVDDFEIWTKKQFC